MPVQLSEHDEALIQGHGGPAAQMAMRILVSMAEVQGVEEFLDISAAHIDSALYMGDATLEYAERLAGGGATVVVPTTLNVAGVDPHGWREWAVPPAWADKATRQMRAYERMGCRPTWTCAPYQTEPRPAFGQQVAWGESSAIVFANSVLGARTERYPDLLDICAAITGRVPAAGLHLTENRAGNVLVRLSDIPTTLQETEDFYPVLGHLIGRLVHDRIPVIEGMTVRPGESALKALGAAMASSGAVALFHLVGVTPEAPTTQDAFAGGEPDRTITIGMKELRDARAELTSADGTRLDMVVLGSPHFSLDEFRALAPLLLGHTRNDAVRFLVTTSRAVKLLAERGGLLDALAAFGGEITVDTCILTTPMLPESVGTLMTNSAKYAYYTPSLLGKGMVFGSMRDCVRSAVVGRVVREEGAWSA